MEYEPTFVDSIFFFLPEVAVFFDKFCSIFIVRVLVFSTLYLSGKVGNQVVSQNMKWAM